ncbi:MAG: ribosome small subunit-dependent GTPase A [Verrucomicrobiota bacterium]|nr:ribosome small subunit-dependent GTPase A [Verrucomicrobiota bacterium]
MDLTDLGWNSFFESAFLALARDELVPGRVLVEHKRQYRVWTEAGEIVAEISGKMRHGAREPAHYPTVGDWVAVIPRADGGKAVIHCLLPRKSKFSRKAAGDRTVEQLMAANVDVIFLMMSLNQDFSVRRLERYLTMMFESGARPVVLLSKADIFPDWARVSKEVEAVARGATVLAVSAVDGTGIDAIRGCIGRGITVVVLGSSGVGKSTLINLMAGEELMDTQTIREDDDEGRHTTTHRELVVLPGGGLLIDTPGLREFQLWETTAGLESTFTDLDDLSLTCRFSNCRHETEPGCAVRAAIDSGKLELVRLQSYQKLQEELRSLEKRRQRMSDAPPKRSR